MKLVDGSGDSLDVDVCAASPMGAGLRLELDIEALYAAHAPFIARVLIRLSGDGAHIDDLLQETFIVAFRKRREFEGRSSERTWLYGIAARLCMRYQRDARRFRSFRERLSKEPAPPAEPAPDRDVDRQHKRALVDEVLSKLPFRQREVFVLYELDELEGKEIVELLGIPIGTVWTRLHHARKKFEKLMRPRLEAV